MADAPDENEVPEGAAVFPVVPPELGIHPLLLAVIHAVVFLEGSGADVVNGAAAQEQLELIAGSLQRLDGDERRRVREDMATLVGFAKEDKWDKGSIQFLKNFLDDFGVK